jgi:hypothetical protein
MSVSMMSAFTGILLGSLLWGADPTTPASTKDQTTDAARPVAPPPPVPEAAVPLNPQQSVLLDKAGQRLWLKGEVCLTEGVLEMLVCPKKTKEHEAIFAVDTQAQTVHAGLLALGLEPGHPVRFAPEYQPATGPKLDIFITWNSPEGKPNRVAARELVRNSVRRYWVEKVDPMPADLKLDPDGDLRYDEKRKELFWYGPMSDAQRDAALKESKDPRFQAAIRKIHASTQLKLLDAEFLFAGSGFHVDEQTKERFYLAESGDLICVANFATATIDLAITSSANKDELLYEAYSEQLPARGTPVVIELIPRRKETDATSR